MSQDNQKTQLAVLGGGPGGYVAAFYAADMGMEVTLIDPDENPGGVCLHRGCIPSKALLHIAKLVNEAAEAKEWGVEFSAPKINLDKLRSWKESVVNKLTSGIGQLSKQRKVNHIRGMGKIVNNTTLELFDINNKGIGNLEFEHLIIATGSRPAIVPQLKIDSPNQWDSTSALELRSIPKTLLVIGGGYIGLELGSVYAALGTKVTVVEMLPSILMGADKDLSNILSKAIHKKFEKVLLNTQVAALKEMKNGIKVSFQNGEWDGESKLFEAVLVAVGRRPNSADIGIDRTNIVLNKFGFIEVDLQRRTKEPNIFAIGDIAGEPMLAHKASHEGKVAVDAILGKQTTFEPNAIPAVVFTDPEVAWCGLTETEAKKINHPISVAKFPWGASGRAATQGHSEGLTKIIIDKNTEQVLGVGIVGHNAGELISECVLAIEMGANIHDIALSIHPHPTLSETVMEAADAYLGHATHFYRPKK